MSGTALYLGGATAAGIALGAVYFAGVRWSAELLAAGRGPGLAVTLTVGRFALLACVLTLVSLHGAGPLLAMTLGLLFARTAMLRGARPGLAP